MKKELIYYIFLGLVVVGLIIYEVFKSNKESRIIQVESFEKVKVDLDCQVFVSLGEEQKVVLEGPSPYLDRIEVHMEEGILQISEKTQGLTSQMFGTFGRKKEKVCLYLRLKRADQLIVPNKDNLISNERNLNVAEANCAELSTGNPIFKLLHAITTRIAWITLPIL